MQASPLIGHVKLRGWAMINPCLSADLTGRPVYGTLQGIHKAAVKAGQRFITLKLTHYPLSRRRGPVLPQARQRPKPSGRQRDRVGVLAVRGLLPLIEVIDRHEAAPPLERLAECGLALDPL